MAPRVSIRDGAKPALLCKVIIRRQTTNRDFVVQLTRESSAANLIRAWEAGRVRIGERWVSGNFIVSAEKVLDDWPAADAVGLSLDDLAPAIELEPEIILVGTGSVMVLPDVDLMAALAERAIGLEIMTTPAACRTYNVLVHEQRRVVAALFNMPPSAT
jgi:uncharacterized protein